METTKTTKRLLGLTAIATGFFLINAGWGQTITVNMGPTPSQLQSNPASWQPYSTTYDNFCTPVTITASFTFTRGSIGGQNPTLRPFAYTWRILKNGDEVQEQIVTECPNYVCGCATGNCTTNYISTDLNTSITRTMTFPSFVPEFGASYKVELIIEDLDACVLWCDWSQRYSRLSMQAITFTRNATPSLLVKNYSGSFVGPTADGSPIIVNKSLPWINGINSTCETAYFVGVQESDRWWNRTYAYEWGIWYQGTAPDNLYLNVLANLLGYGNLQDGFLPGGLKRYYRVSLCVGDGGWDCKNALIRLSTNGLEIVAPQDPAYAAYSADKVTEEMRTLAENSPHYIYSSESDHLTLDVQPVENEQALTVYPNPSEGVLNARINANPQNIQKILVIDIQGKIIHETIPTTNFFTTDLSDVPPGIYIVQLITNGNIYNHKWIKQ